jgi:hypothetical protein
MGHNTKRESHAAPLTKGVGAKATDILNFENEIEFPRLFQAGALRFREGAQDEIATFFHGQDLFAKGLKHSGLPDHRGRSDAEVKIGTAVFGGGVEEADEIHIRRFLSGRVEGLGGFE